MFKKIFGPTSDIIKEKIHDVMARKTSVSALRSGPATIGEGSKNEAAASSKVDEIVSPLTGELKPITEVPDQVFAGKMMGDGFAVLPTDGEIVSPVNGEVINLFPTKHAVGILSENGLEILVHFGTDTVKLDGKGFEVLVKQGGKVKAGQPILKVNLDFVKGKIPTTMTPILFTNLAGKEVILNKSGDVKAGDKDIITIK